MPCVVCGGTLPLGRRKYCSKKCCNIHKNDKFGKKKKGASPICVSIKTSRQLLPVAKCCACGGAVCNVPKYLVNAVKWQCRQCFRAEGFVDAEGWEVEGWLEDGEETYDFSEFLD
jgi:hypothetical protein